MPPRTRKSESDVADPQSPVTEVDAEQVEPERQPGPASMFDGALKIAEQRMVTRMDTLAAQQGERSEQLGLSLDAVTRKLGEIGLGQQAVSEIMAELEQRVSNLSGDREVSPQEDEWNAENNGRLNEAERLLSGLGAASAEQSAWMAEINRQLAAMLDGAEERRTDPAEEAEADWLAVLHGAGTETSKHILSAIWAVMRDVEGVGKHGVYVDNGKVKYKFRAFDDIADALGKAFRQYGVMIQSKIVDKQVERAMVNGKYWTACSITVEYVFTSLVDGSTVSFEAVGEGRDLSDKAHGKAMTMAAKSALGQAFMLAVGDDDPDASRPGDDSVTGEVEPNVRRPASETPAQQAAREQFETRRAARTAEPEAPKDHVADAQQQLERQLGAREVVEPGGPGDNEPIDGGDWGNDGDGDSGRVPPETGVLPSDQVAMERAQRALAAARTKGVDFARLNKIIGQAHSEGILQVVLEGTSLQSHLIAINRTVL